MTLTNDSGTPSPHPRGTYPQFPSRLVGIQVCQLKLDGGPLVLTKPLGFENWSPVLPPPGRDQRHLHHHKTSRWGTMGCIVGIPDALSPTRCNGISGDTGPTTVQKRGPHAGCTVSACWRFWPLARPGQPCPRL